MAKYTSIPDTKLKQLSLGFFVPGVDLASYDPTRLLQSDEVWEQIAGLFLACELGNFSALHHIPSIMKDSDAYLVWQAGTNLAGLAGNLGVVKDVFKPFEKDGSGAEYFMTIALGQTLNPDAIEMLLTLHNDASDEETRYQIERELSYLLEDTNGPIISGADESIESEDEDTVHIINRQDYFPKVTAALSLVREQLPVPNTPILGGKVFDVVKFARRLLERVGSAAPEIGRIHRHRLIFEAATGVNCAAFFDDPVKLNSLQATAILEAFLDSDDVRRFVPGQRYFFGHPIGA
ncbi:hypothetical protein NKJ16_03275 [Mesorhizobium sp. M0179]|uniref:hypothetical protein n=1 Tax=unclassified Mesorhizobium TaxID=325217 RepID=UPI0012EB28F7|nr:MULTISPECIES: hypothetical protein [unclassified Mesorhizobium]WJI67912.1 hypothetical protein NLY36_24415 [Mesorhizobium sp. C399B]